MVFTRWIIRRVTIFTTMATSRRVPGVPVIRLRGITDCTERPTAAVGQPYPWAVGFGIIREPNSPLTAIRLSTGGNTSEPHGGGSFFLDYSLMCNNIIQRLCNALVRAYRLYVSYACLTCGEPLGFPGTYCTSSCAVVDNHDPRIFK